MSAVAFAACTNASRLLLISPALQIAVLVMMTGLGLLSGSSIMAPGKTVGGAPLTCMDSLVCSAARVGPCIVWGM